MRSASIYQLQNKNFPFKFVYDVKWLPPSLKKILGNHDKSSFCIFINLVTNGKKSSLYKI